MIAYAALTIEDELKQAFYKLERQLVFTRVLAHFYLFIYTVVSIDAFATAINAVFAHVQLEGSESYVAYASKTLSLLSATSM